MAIDKTVDSGVLDGLFTDIADAIRGKNGETAQYTPSEMPAAIAGIPAGVTLTRGTVYGTKSLTTIDTGLTTITCFCIFPNYSISGDYGAHVYAYDGTNGKKWRVYTQSKTLYSKPDADSSLIISGGTVQLGASAASYLQSGMNYTWFAAGS